MQVLAGAGAVSLMLCSAAWELLGGGGLVRAVGEGFRGSSASLSPSELQPPLPVNLAVSEHLRPSPDALVVPT